MQNSFIALKILYALPIHPSPFPCPQLLATSYLFTLCIALPFPECHVVSRIIQYRVFGDWFLLFSNMRLNFPGDSDGKESACNAGDLGLIPGLRRSPGEGSGNPLQYSYLKNFLPGECHGQRSLAGYSPWGCKQSDRTE